MISNTAHIIPFFFTKTFSTAPTTSANAEMPQDGKQKKLQLVTSTGCSEDYTTSFKVQL